MLEIKNLNISYGNGNLSLNNFSLNMKEGEIVGIVGESGSGKTTLLRAVTGLLPFSGKITEGEILFYEKNLSAADKKEWNAVRGKEISIIFQDCGSMLNPIRKIGSQFIEYIQEHESISKKDAYEKAVEKLGQMGLLDGERMMKSYPFQLSGGMRQRVGIAMAMTYKPKLLLADEPTSALDVTTQAQIVEQMKQLRQEHGTAILLVTHNLGVASYLADYLIVMKNGEIVETGKTEEVLTNPQNSYTKILLQAAPVLGGERYV